MSVVRNPVVLFLATGLLALVAIVAATDQLSHSAAAEEAVADARASTEMLARTLVEPELPRGLVEGDAGALDRFDRTMVERIPSSEVVRIKLWNRDGRIVYSDETELIGETFPLDEDEVEILERGGTEAEVSVLSRPENRFERDLEPTGLLEVYTRIESPEGQPLLFEVYYSATDIAMRQQEIFTSFRPIVLSSVGLVVLVATALLWGLTRRLRRSAEERERLLLAAADASDAERVRIARDLHDGVVQDLAGASFAVSALARSADLSDPARGTLEDAGGSLRTSLRSLRSLMVEIYPPDLHAEGLEVALQDLLAPAATRGMTATAHVSGGVENVSDDTVALVWRVAQEAVRNALRHSGAGRLRVWVDVDDEQVVLEVGDDGRGFDPTERLEGAHFGLRGLTSLVREAGGSLTVESVPGQGTTVRLELAREGRR